MARTDLTIEAKVKGFASAQRELGKLHRTNQKAVREQLQGTQATDRELKNLRGRLKDLTEVQTALLKAMSATKDQGGKAFQDLDRQLKTTEQDATRVVRAIRNMEKALGGADTKGRALERTLEKSLGQGGFTQGFVQGFAPQAAAGLQRGPGWQRQVAGMGAGRGARGLGGGLLGTPFGGLQALAGGLQSLPGGGLVAAPLLAAGAQAGQALQFQQQLLRAGPGLQQLLRPETTPAMEAQARRAATASLATPLDAGVVEARARQLRETAVNEELRGRSARQYRTESELYAQMAAGGIQAAQARSRLNALRQNRRRGAGGAVERRAGPGGFRGQAIFDLANERAQSEYEASIRAQRRAGTARLRAQGVSLGMSLPEVVALQSQVAMAGGGAGNELRGRAFGGQGLGMVAMAAQQGLGIGPGASGAFLQAGRRGGLVGGLGRSGDAMVEAIRDGMELGLEGSELSSYMQVVAEGISSWQQTGVPLNQRSMSTLSTAFARLGLGAVQGGRVGRGVGAGLSRIGTRGPQSAFDFLALTRLGGMQSLAPDETLRARVQLEEMGAQMRGGQVTPEVLGMLQDLVRQSGGRRGFGAGMLGSVLQQLGVQVSARQLQTLTTRLESGGGIGDLLAPLAPGAGPASAEDFVRQQQQRVQRLAPGVSRQATITNRQLSTGEAMLASVQKFEEAQTKITRQFSRLSPVIEGIADGAVKVADTIPRIVDGLSRLADILDDDKVQTALGQVSTQ